MPECVTCGALFKNRVEIDGKIRNLGNRKRCLTCSPFGSHNTKRAVPKDQIENISTCRECGKTYEYKRSSGGTKTRCPICTSRERVQKRKRKCVDYKGGKCEVCGYSKCVAALDFHHVDPFTKKFPISGNHCRSWEVVKEELNKCMLVCRNCHAEIHYYN